MTEPSRSQVDRAGKRIRHAIRAGDVPSPSDLAIVDTIRLRHAGTVAFLQRVATEVASDRHAEVASRLKTRDAIVAKLSRSTTALSQVQDIAGARIILPSLVAARSATEQLVAELRGGGCASRVVDPSDHLGYRAIHIVVEHGDARGEIQLRTTNQQIWAQAVERWDRTLGTDLKHGDGPIEWVQWLLETSVALHQADLGNPYTLRSPPL